MGLDQRDLTGLEHHETQTDRIKVSKGLTVQCVQPSIIRESSYPDITSD